MLVSLKTIVIFILALSFFVFVTFFGRLPALRHTPIAGLHRLIWVHAPNAVVALDQKLTSGRITRSLVKFSNYILYDRHPTVVIFFLLILTVSEYLFLPSAWPKIGWFTKFTAILTVAAPYTFLYLACSSDPGYVTPETHAYYMTLYPYDHALFHPGPECSTCRLPKPARSKHCSTCKRCVAKSDHHCIFINSCVGYGNQHWFLLLLLSTAILTTYGGLLGLSIITDAMRERFPLWSLWSPRRWTFQQNAVIWAWGLHKNVTIGATMLLALLTAPLVWGLFSYTLWLVYCGTTTNESLKWSEWKEDMVDGYAFGRELPASRQRNTRADPQCSRWPSEPLQILVTTADGKPPVNSGKLQGQGDWQHVWSLKGVDNLYDQGFWHNLLDVFLSDYWFGKKRYEPLSGRTWRTRQAAKQSAYPP